MALVLLKTFDNSTDAYILKARLEAEEITCYLFDEHIVSVFPLYNNAVGGIKLKVNEEDLEHCKQVLQEVDEAVYVSENGETISCPACTSNKVISGYCSFNTVGGVLSAIFSIIMGIFPPFYKRVYRCKNCGYEFNRLHAPDDAPSEFSSKRRKRALVKVRSGLIVLLAGVSLFILVTQFITGWLLIFSFLAILAVGIIQLVTGISDWQKSREIF